MTVVRCSVRSEAIDEPLAGTASRVRRYLLLEAPGPWGVEVLRDSRLPLDLKRELRRRSRASGVRVLLIRRYGRAVPGGRPQVFVADTDPARPYLATCLLTDHREVLDLAIWTPGVVRDPGLSEHREPVFLVCTHGRHDACCAERGRPVAHALSTAYPDQTWESSHLGGDRFAGNLLCLPHGITYGRVPPEGVVSIASRYALGRLDLDHLRGRSSYPFPVQAAEWHLRRRLAATRIDDVVLRDYRSGSGDMKAVFEVRGGAAWSVHIGISHAAPQLLTCRATQALAPPRYELLAIQRVE